MSELTPPTEQAQINDRLWRAGEHVAVYATRELAPAEVMILVRYQKTLAGRVLEVGCGAGRILSYLVDLAAEAFAIDVSPAMVDYCRRTYPAADVRVGDLRELERRGESPYDAIFAGGNVIDVLDDSERRLALASWRELIAPDGLLIFNSHNLAVLDPSPSEARDSGRGQGVRPVALLRKALNHPPADVVRAVTRLPRRSRNRRRLGPLEKRAADHAIVNDEVFDYGLLHYYIRRDDQERQLAELGYELIECLDGEGHTVAPGEAGQGSSLHYIARVARDN